MMQSRRSCFNKQLFFKYVKQYWPLWAASILVSTLAIPVVFIRVYNSLGTGITANDVKAALISVMNPVFYFSLAASAFYSIVSSTLLNSYLFNTSKTTFFHALPFRRSELFFTNTVSGLLFIIVPGFVSCLLGAIAGFTFGVNILGHMAALFGGLLVCVLFFYSFATICAMVTGQAAFSYVFYLVLIPYMDIMSYPVGSVSFRFVYGINSRIMEDLALYSPSQVLSRMLEFSNDYGTQIRYTTMIIYTLIAAAFFFLAYKLYSIRKLETAGDTICFPFIRPVFRWGVGISSMFVSAWIFPEIFSYRSSHSFLVLTVITGVLAGLVGFLAAEMIMKKTFRIFSKIYKEMLVFVGVMLAFFLMLGLDVFGVEKKVPEPDEIKNIMVYYDGYGFDLEDPDDVKKATQFHSFLVENKDKILDQNSDFAEYGGNSFEVYMVDMIKPYDFGSGQTSFIKFEYSLKDGSELNRQYTVVTDPGIKDPKTIQGRICEFFDDPSIVEDILLPDGNVRDRIREVSTDLYRSAKQEAAVNEPQYAGGLFESRNYVFTNEDAQALYDAIIKDIREGNLKYNYNYYREDSYVSSLCLVIEEEELEDTGLDRSRNERINKTCYIDLSSECVNIIKFFEEKGCFKDGYGFVTYSEYYK
ncbi:MAG: hypothetical protein ILP10_02250 [Lachnospiraceae bacterium]|nr:hypothetical protein [Lachnospiraceae bacterium]